MQDYLAAIAAKYKDPQNSEMGFRTEFENFLESLFPKADGYHIHHDARAVAGNKPDFVVLKDKVPILYIENKTVGTDLDKIEQSNQMDRYFGYANLILTDQIEFRFYRNGQAYCDPISVGVIDVKARAVTPKPEHFEHLQKTLVDFPKTHKEPITRGAHLAQIMGGKARRIRDNVADILEHQSEGDIQKLFATIQKLLVHNMDNQKFADMYAQTLVYGLFVARFYDETPDDFSRQEARDLVPKSNPFLMHFFDHISGVNFETRLRYIVDELCEVFQHANVEELLTQYFGKNLWGDETEGPDPVIHFYEDFLKEYDADLRKQMGAYYTPTPVVRFMVRAVDQILKTDFGLRDGLADTAKYPDGTHRVQVLDPATGTGTFISAVIRRIYEHILETGQKGSWPKYVHHELLPRLHAFELMMGPYTIAHLKLGMAFERTGFKHFNRRLGIYLTNALEDPTAQESMFAGLGVAESIAKESKEAAKIKRDLPVMVVIGNPPYSGESQNANYKGHDVYKVEPGGRQKLQERNSKWLNDDYVKFIRLGESLVEKNGQGIVSMVTAHGYIDNPTFRGMRWHLRQTFDKIYVLDLHGNSNKKEVSLDGSPDENVFAIKTGVSIILGVKTKEGGSELATIYKADLYGKRLPKLATMSEADLVTIDWDELPADTETWVRAGEGMAEYEQGFSLVELFPVNSVGIVTSRDSFVIDTNREALAKRIFDFTQIPPIEAQAKYSLKENKKWKIAEAQKHHFGEQNIHPISYRPFDKRFVYYHNDMIERSRESVMKHFLAGENVGLIYARSQKNRDWNALLVTSNIMETKCGEASTQSQISPLYLYENDTKTTNLNPDIWHAINDVVGDTTPENILDYVYAVLHSPSYRERYQEFLKADFPRVPYPDSKEVFWDLVPLGRQLRQLHLMDAATIPTPATSFPIEGSDTVESGYPKFAGGRVQINAEQYFDGVSEAAWNFYIGGYQPAQKWLKDRRGHELTYEEIRHYQNIITALSETDRIMKEIDGVSEY